MNARITAHFLLGLCLLFGAWNSIAWSQEYPYLYRSANLLSRGDAGIATAENEDAIFYNPAGLSKGKGIYKITRIMTPMLEFSKNTRDIVKRIAVQENDPTSTFREQQGKAQHLGFNQFTGVILRKVALGAFAHSSSTAMLYKDPQKGAFESILANSISDLGLTFSLAQKVWKKNLSVGLTAKYIRRSQAYLYANATETDKFSSIQSDELAMTGSATGADLGLIYQTKGMSYGLTIQDVGNTKMIPDQTTNLSKEDRALKDLTQTINLGIAAQTTTRSSHLEFALDLRDILNATKQHILKRFHFGMELGVSNFIGFAAGINQGYGSFGLFSDIRFFRVDLGLYAEETGELPGSRPDERYFLRLSASI